MSRRRNCCCNSCCNTGCNSCNHYGNGFCNQGFGNCGFGNCGGYGTGFGNNPLLWILLLNNNNRCLY
ncbi:MAG: hypothetical protein ACRDDY_06120 [Clostridium sp.]|uniref:hypothetical protein n=1 Tax=Clostridium sp. TaxID=1506 RepID=UPI003EE798C7